MAHPALKVLLDPLDPQVTMVLTVLTALMAWMVLQVALVTRVLLVPPVHRENLEKLAIPERRAVSVEATSLF